MEQIVDIQEMKIVNAGSIKQTASHLSLIHISEPTRGETVSEKTGGGGG